MLVDDLTEGLNSLCKDNLDISKVLRFERTLLSQQQRKVSKQRGLVLWLIYRMEMLINVCLVMYRL